MNIATGAAPKFGDEFNAASLTWNQRMEAN